MTHSVKEAILMPVYTSVAQSKPEKGWDLIHSDPDSLSVEMPLLYAVRWCKKWGVQRLAEFIPRSCISHFFPHLAVSGRAAVGFRLAQGFTRDSKVRPKCSDERDVTWYPPDRLARLF